MNDKDIIDFFVGVSAGIIVVVVSYIAINVYRTIEKMKFK